MRRWMAAVAVVMALWGCGPPSEAECSKNPALEGCPAAEEGAPPKEEHARNGGGADDDCDSDSDSDSR